MATTAPRDLSFYTQRLLDEVEQARGRGETPRPVLMGPLSYLWLDQANGGDVRALARLEIVLPVYGEIFTQLARLGVEWVQIDEPVLAQALPQAWTGAFERAYHILQYSPLKKLLAVYGGPLQDNLGLAAHLPVDGLHVDLANAPAQLTAVLDRVPSYKVLSLGLAIDDTDLWRCELETVQAQLQPARRRFGDNLWLVGARWLADLGGLLPDLRPARHACPITT